MDSTTTNLRIGVQALAPAVVLACVQVACTRRDVIEVACAAAKVATVAVVDTLVQGAIDARERSHASSEESAPWNSDACTNPECYGDTEVTLDEARSLAADLLDQERMASGLASLTLDGRLTEDAQMSSQWLARDHQSYSFEFQERCLAADRRPPRIAILFDPYVSGDTNMDIETEVVEALAKMMREAPGNGCRDTLLSRRWRHFGIGLSNPDGRLYLALEFSE
jgi:hypothetical protein